MEKLEWFGKK